MNNTINQSELEADYTRPVSTNGWQAREKVVQGARTETISFDLAPDWLKRQHLRCDWLEHIIIYKVNA